MNVTWSDVMKFELPPSPIIFDVGGYEGTWTDELLKNGYGL